MQVKAKAKYLRVSPRKARLVVDLVRGLDVEVALAKIAITNKKSVRFVEKLINSAIASAEHNLELKRENLYIKEIKVDDGPIFYRWMPRAHGRATRLRKRTSLISLILDEKIPSKAKSTAKKEKIDTVKLDENVATVPAQDIKQTKHEKAEKTIDIDKKEEDKFDANRVKGGHRDMQQNEKFEKKQKGVFQKMFRRKSGM